MSSSPKISFDRRIRVAYFKWEFLRRNDQYKKDYREAMARGRRRLLKRLGYPTPGYVDKLPQDVRDFLGGLHFNWNVGFMQDPEWTAPLTAMKANERCRTLNPFWNTHERTILDDVDILDARTVRFKNPAIDLWGAKRWRWRAIAINFFANADVLKESVAEHIDRIRAEVREEFPEWLRRADGPMEKYLAAWDLREKKNWPYLKIAKKLFPKKAAAIALAERNTSYSYSAATMESASMDDGPDLLAASEDADPESWIKLIRRYCRRAQALIDGRYQALS